MAERSTDELARKIATILESDPAFSRASNSSIEELAQRVEILEDRLKQSPSHSRPETGSLHPSQQKFDVAEAVADQIFDNYENEKACTFEPNGKPCDHCLMCNTRGF